MSMSSESSSEGSFSIEREPPPQPFIRKSMLFILCAEFCERFSFYGIRGIIKTFLTDDMNYRKSDANMCLKVFTILCFVFPMIGGYICDRLLGKFRTIFLLGLIYGGVCVCLAFFGSLKLPFISEILLIMLAFGSGGIKPCILTIGGDQFDQAREKKHLSAFFFWFYMMINLGAVLAIVIAIWVNKMLVFCMSAVMLVIALAVFIIGKPKYKTVKPQPYVPKNAFKCIRHALKQRKHNEKKKHWLDHASPKYDEEMIDDLKATMRLLILFIPMPCFWMLYFQQWEIWLTQLNKTNRFLANKLYDDMLFDKVNPICIIVLIPLFQYCIYPLLGKLHLFQKLLHRVVAGGILAAIAYLIAASVALEMEKSDTVDGVDKQFYDTQLVNILLINGGPCDFDLKARVIHENGPTSSFSFPMFTMYHYSQVPVLDEDKKLTVEFSLKGNCDDKKHDDESLSVDFHRGDFTVLTFMYGYSSLNIQVKRHIDGNPLVNVHIGCKNPDTKYDAEFYYNGEMKLLANDSNKVYALPFPNYYDIKVQQKLVRRQEFKPRSIYIITVPVIINRDKSESYNIAIWEIVSNDRLEFVWLLPQYIVLAIGEVMFVISGIEFLYTQAPASMKCLIQAFWLLMVAIGILLVWIAEPLIANFKMSTIFFAHAIIMFVDIGIFAFLSFRYKYKKELIY